MKEIYFTSSTIQDDRDLLRAFALSVMRSIAKRHGGLLHVNHGTNTVDFIVPDGKEDEVIMEVMEQVGQFIL